MYISMEQYLCEMIILCRDRIWVDVLDDCDQELEGAQCSADELRVSEGQDSLESFLKPVDRERDLSKKDPELHSMLYDGRSCSIFYFPPK
jgi:hypothetical protein